jgi:beta-aspartyl-peptidase (threonine type)
MSICLESGSFGGPGPTLLVHGGAWDIPDSALADHRDGLREAVERGRERLLDGTAALDVVTAVVVTLEEHGAFDAGRGAMLNQDAGVMDGASLAYGAVMATRRLPRPVRVARRLLDAGDGRVRMLTGEGAERFAEAEGMDLVENSRLICDRERERYEKLRTQAEAEHPSASFLPGAPNSDAGADTVGCVARDREGRVAAATSTGGTPFKPPGRVGDSPLPGAGFYATPGGAASATGWGEAIAAVVLSSRAVDALNGDASPETVARRRLRHMHESVTNPEGKGATGGLLLLDAEGRGAWAYTTPRMARAGWNGDDGFWVDV